VRWDQSPGYLMLASFAAAFARTGLFLSVRDTNAPPPSAQYLLLALAEFGLQAVRSASAKLSDANALELLVGLRRTSE
jgi:hypothetical protein